MYFYWGWNRCAFTNSDISFTSDNYDFTLDNVEAKDRATAFSLEQYFAIDKFTIPQYNFRLGYFFNEKYDLSFGIDHLKYVMIPDQIVNINGSIRNTRTFHNNENYQGEDIIELALDSGEICTTPKSPSLVINEIEIELVSGNEMSLFELAKKLNVIISMTPSNVSKAARGYTLFHEEKK